MSTRRRANARGNDNNNRGQRRTDVAPGSCSDSDSDSDSPHQGNAPRAGGLDEIAANRLAVEKATAMVLLFDDFKELQRQKVKEREPIVASAWRRFWRQFATMYALAGVFLFIKIFSKHIEPWLVLQLQYVIAGRFKFLISIGKGFFSLCYLGIAYMGYLATVWVYGRVGMHAVDKTDDTDEIFSMYRESAGMALKSAVPSERELLRLERRANRPKKPKNKKWFGWFRR